MALPSRTASWYRAPEWRGATTRRLRPQHTSSHGDEACLLRGEDIAWRLSFRAQAPPQTQDWHAVLKRVLFCDASGFGQDHRDSARMRSRRGGLCDIRRMEGADRASRRFLQLRS